MTHWIKWLTGSAKPAPAPQKSEGEVRLDGDTVIYTARQGYREAVIDLTQLQYVYVYTTENCQTLVLNDYHQHLIPCSAAGFALLFQHLSQQLAFDEKKFFEALAGNKAVKAELWRAKGFDNCRIPDLSDDGAQLSHELSEGFWVCAETRHWISWDMTSEALAVLPFVHQTTNEYGLTEIRFHHPVQLGNLLLDDWRYYLPAHLRLDVPLDSFYTNLRIQGNGDQNYFLAKKALMEILGKSIEGYEREDQNNCQWLFHGLKFSLIYWYDGKYSYESGYTYLSVQNERSYPNYLIDQHYELNATISKRLLIEHNFRIGSDFRRSQYFRQTPQTIAKELIASSKNFMIWLDEPNGKAGFANEENAMIFPIAALTGFSLQNVLPDRSSGGTYLSAILKEGDPQSILIGDCRAFDPYITQAVELLQLPVHEIDPYEA